MPNNNDNRKLLLYIIISIILHLLTLYFLPIGFLHGSAQSENELDDYGYVQMIEYQPAPLKEKNVEEEAELTEDPTDEKLDQVETEIVEEETESDSVPELEAKSETEITQSETKPEQAPEVEDKIESEQEVELENKTTKELDESKLVEEAPKPEAESNLTSESQSESEPEAELESEPEADFKKNIDKVDENIIASEESDSEVEIIQEESSVKEEIPETSSESSDSKETAEVETSAEENTTVNESQEVEKSEKSKTEEKEISPPPPPTAGDLIGLIEPPAFPKDLVGSRSEGTVELLVELSPTGSVNRIQVKESSGYDSMDRVAQLTLEHGWEFKEYQHPYQIPVTVKYYIDKSDNTKVEVNIGQIKFIEGGE